MPRVIGGRYCTYLLVTGVRPVRRVDLAPGIELIPVTSIPQPDQVLDKVEDIDIHFVALFLPWVESQIRVAGRGSTDVATRAWNSLWDVLLLSAIYTVATTCVLQSTSTLERFGKSSKIHVIHYHFYDHPARNDAYKIGESECVWLEENFRKAQSLLHDHRFRTAVHCLATYRWHSLPRAQLALLWAGIESLFAVDTEIVFRVSLYAAKFLSPTDRDVQREIFESVRQLYKFRSQAVHGGKLKEEPRESVANSALLLSQLVRACVERNELPDLQGFVP